MIRDGRGDLSTYLAAAMILPLLLLILFGGLSCLHLYTLQEQLVEARSVGLEAACADGGVTSQVVQLISQDLAAQGISGNGLTVTGTPPPVGWGGTIRLTVTLSVPLTGFPWDLLGAGAPTVTLGGTAYGTSDLPPS